MNFMKQVEDMTTIYPNDDSYSTSTNLLEKSISIKE